MKYHKIRIFRFLVLFFIILACKEKSKKVENPIKSIPLKQNISNLEQQLLDQNLVNITAIDSSIRVELKYSTTDNFFKQDVYGDLENAYFQKITAKKLKIANHYLKEINPDYTLLIYDGVRPLSVQKILWNAIDSIPPKKRKDFVADPEEGSIHNYGCAVDLSVFDNSTQNALDMGTKYDFFGYLAYPRKENEMLEKGLLSQKQVNNRIILRTAMEKAGFEPITSEWWHFNLYSRKQAKLKFKIIQ